MFIRSLRSVISYSSAYRVAAIAIEQFRFNFYIVIMASFRLVMASCLLTASVAAQSVVDLSAFSWKLSQPSGNISDIPASFPSQAHLDLYENQIIPYPQYGLGDFDHRWVCYSNWTYSATLTGL